MKFYESEYEAALIALLQEVGWDYTHGSKLYHRNDELLLTEDLFGSFLSRHPELEPDGVTNIIDHLRHASGQTHFDRLRAGCGALGKPYSSSPDKKDWTGSFQ